MTGSMFPNELIDNIVDCLKDDFSTLKNTCLVSKQWLPRSRLHLFRNISPVPAVREGNANV